MRYRATLRRDGTQVSRNRANETRHVTLLLIVMSNRVYVTACFVASLVSLSSPCFAQRPSMPDLGPNVLIFSPSQPAAEIQAAINKVYAVQQNSEFGPDRNALLFMPGDYHVDVPIGFYTEVRGLGASPDAVHITGNVHSDASRANNNATCTFWRSVENFSVTPTGGTMQWAVSQAAPMRRMHVLGDLVLHQKRGWASGGWMSDTRVDGNVDSGTQQQWISRNSDWKSWTGSNWNMVFVGSPEAPANAWPKPGYTTVDRTPISREKPFLQVSKAGVWSVTVPGVQHDSIGATWSAADHSSDSIALDRFYIAHAGHDTAATINAQLAKGKHLLLTPGQYDLSEPIRVMRAETVVLGLGFATLRPTQGTPAVLTADVSGVTIAGITVDAGPVSSPMLMQIGIAGSHAPHRMHPILLADVFFRDGGETEGKTVNNLEVNSDDTIIDHTWIWRADHGTGVGWTKNLSANGLIVNGNDVIAYGLFVEHHQQFQVVWNGERGRTYLYQSEIPYDPPTQTAYTSAPGTDGWAAYKVGAQVRQHEAWGLGIYSVFTHPDVWVSRAIEAPQTSGVRFHDMITVCLLTKGGIRNIADDQGGAATCTPRNWPRLTSFPSAPAGGQSFSSW
jgi:hypothetical protein